MGMGFAPTWLRQVSPLLHKTTLTTDKDKNKELTYDLTGLVGYNTKCCRQLGVQ